MGVLELPNLTRTRPHLRRPRNLQTYREDSGDLRVYSGPVGSEVVVGHPPHLVNVPYRVGSDRRQGAPGSSRSRQGTIVSSQFRSVPGVQGPAAEDRHLGGSSPPTSVGEEWVSPVLGSVGTPRLRPVPSITSRCRLGPFVGLRNGVWALGTRPLPQSL